MNVAKLFEVQVERQIPLKHVVEILSSIREDETSINQVKIRKKKGNAYCISKARRERTR